MISGLLAAAMLGSLRSEPVQLHGTVFRPYGRWSFAQGDLRFQWPATGFSIGFSGTSASVTLEDSAPGTVNKGGGFDSDYIAVRVDGGEFKDVRLLPGIHDYVLAKDLPRGEHKVEVYKRTESSVGWIRLKKMDVPGAGTDMSVPEQHPPALEVYGDSNTCGYGVEGSSKEDHYRPETANATLSYAFIAAQECGYELRMIAASGWGIMRGYGGQLDANIPSVYDRSLWQIPQLPHLEEGIEAMPKVMMVVLGDNDFAQGDPGAEFDAKYLAFVKTLRKRAPEAKIVLCRSAVMYDSDKRKARTRVGKVIDGIIKQLGDSKILKFDFPVYQEAWGHGADWHMSRTGQAEVGKAVAKFLKTL